MLYTLGHSTHPLERFAELLAAHGINAVADVRSSPYSRFNPQYNREPLRVSLRAMGSAYVFLGEELGARSDDPACREDGRVSYVRLARTDRFRRGLDRVMEGMTRYRVALLCAEKDPLFCHRAILVSRRMAERGVPIAHIRPDAALETHGELETRLLRHLGIPERDLLHTREQILDTAYALQNARMSMGRK
ncbi:MAG: DUF488 domain-containing protein [Acidobacteria bacterium]|nr:DUF488 domain-containing protein [Acidobacteriota bacterium]